MVCCDGQSLPAGGRQRRRRRRDAAAWFRKDFGGDASSGPGAWSRGWRARWSTFRKMAERYPAKARTSAARCAPALIRFASCDTAAAKCPSCASASRCSAVDMPPGARSRRARYEGNTIILPSVFRKVCATSSSMMAAGRSCQRGFQLLFCEKQARGADSPSAGHGASRRRACPGAGARRQRRRTQACRGRGGRRR
jgi:hypothetical protein